MLLPLALGGDGLWSRGGDGLADGAGVGFGAEAGEGVGQGEGTLVAVDPVAVGDEAGLGLLGTDDEHDGDLFELGVSTVRERRAET